jgi:hypothetical protein
MAHESIQTRGRIRELLSKLSVEDSDGATVKRDRFLALLKSQFGYTNEKAVDELERLLKQFNRINQSLGIHRSRLNFKQPHTVSLETVDKMTDH